MFKFKHTGVLSGIVALLMCFSGVSHAADKPLRVALPMFPTAANPFEVIVQPPIFALTPIFDALTRIDATGQATPSLALKWDTPDSLTWRFHIKPDLRFSNGAALDAAAIAANFNLMQEPASRKYPAALLVANVKSATALVGNILEIKTTTPEPFLDRLVAALRFVDVQQWKSMGSEEYSREPVSSGSYVVNSWKPTEIRLTANPYAPRPPKVAAITLVSQPDPAGRLQSLLSDSVQIALGMGPDDVDAIKDSGAQVAIEAEPGVVVLNFIPKTSKPLQDVRVRQALNYAIDKEAIVRDIVGGHAKVASQTAPPFAFGYNPDLRPYEYDPARAQQLLKEAGYPSGFSFVAESVFGVSGFASLAYQRVSSDLAKIGVKMELRAIPAAKYGKGIYQGQWDGQAFGLEYSVYPSFDALEPLKRHSCLWPTPWYCDEVMTPDLNKALGTAALPERERLTRKVMARQRDQAPGIILYNMVRFDAAAKTVTGFKNTFGTISYEMLQMN